MVFQDFKVVEISERGR